MNKLKRIISSQQTSDPDEELLRTLNDGVKEEDIEEVNPDQGVEVTAELTSEYKPPEPNSTTVDDYLQRQVYLELYGTETPSSYERTLSVLRNKL